ncbi:carcinoembryonic antigen-related cell adhesion molecule 8-like isoform X4 [Lepisosteus oculatus]|uniref:carcinoembryonic antigen-related cell adhesion molecule 8-like isoform X4 n=1 Tax=Lepisosteus oculatus TaxID=7918 RepID=UPI0037234B15
MDTTGALTASLLVLITGCCAQNLLPPGPVDGVVGGSVWFNTTINPTTQIVTITWRFGTSPTSPLVVSWNSVTENPGPGYAGRVSVNRTTGALELRGLTAADNGTYSVYIVTTAPDPLTGVVTLNVFAPVSNVTVQANITDPVEFNDTVRLSCSASGSAPSYRWLNDSSEVTAGQRFQLSESNRTLTISSVLRSDRGPLYCFVSNSISNATSQPVYLNVLYGPEDTSLTPPGHMFPAGSGLTLSCWARSSPPAQYRWSCNGSLTDSTSQELRFVSLQERDSGNYTCWSHNNRTLRYEAVGREITVLAPSGGGGGSSLSGGAIAGIVIAVLVAVGLIAGLVYFLMTRQGSSPRETTNSSVMYENSEGLKDHMMYMNLPAGHQKKAAQPSPAAPESTYTGLQFPDNSTYGNLNRS